MRLTSKHDSFFLFLMPAAGRLRLMPGCRAAAIYSGAYDA